MQALGEGLENADPQKWATGYNLGGWRKLDLSFYSRALQQQTAGWSWINRMTENTFLFSLLSSCGFAFDCPKVGNLMKTSGEKCELHFPPIPESHSYTTCSPWRNTLAIQSDIWVEIGLGNMSSCLSLFWLNVLWEKNMASFNMWLSGDLFSF